MVRYPANSLPGRLGLWLHQFFRTAGVVFGIFILVNWIGDLFIPRFATAFYAGLFPFGNEVAGRVLAIVLALVLILSAGLVIVPSWRHWGKRAKYIPAVFQVILVIGIIVVFFKVLEFYLLLFSGILRSHFPVPASVLIFIMLLMNVWRIRQEFAHQEIIENGLPTRKLFLSHVMSLALVLVTFPLSVVLYYGTTDSRLEKKPCYCQAPYDCIIVYGAKVNHDKSLSTALSDRVRCGVELFKAGWGRYLVMSGGANGTGTSEPYIMKEYAIDLGVPRSRIIIDEKGNKTFNSAVNVKHIMEQRGWHFALSVSHYYHLLRIKLAALRAGLDTETVHVPVEERDGRPSRFRLQAWNLVREVVALYYYYFLEWKAS